MEEKQSHMHSDELNLYIPESNNECNTFTMNVNNTEGHLLQGSIDETIAASNIDLYQRDECNVSNSTTLLSSETKLVTNFEDIQDKI